MKVQRKTDEISIVSFNDDLNLNSQKRKRSQNDIERHRIGNSDGWKTAYILEIGSFSHP